MKPLNRHFYAHDTVEVAKNLLGKLLVHKVGNTTRSGMIVETEAYRGLADPASHAYRNRSKRTIPLFGPVGHAYIYFIYGNHYCMNVVAKSHDQEAGGVLIRALQPVSGIEEMMKARECNYKQLTNGPGKLTEALGITGELNDTDLTISHELFITDYKIVKPTLIKSSPRIGIRVATDKKWRFYIADNRWVS